MANDLAQHSLRDWVVVLVRPTGPVNVGLSCRAVANMGARGIRVVDPGPLALSEERGRAFACKAGALWQNIERFDSLAAATADCDYVLGTTRRLRHGRLPQYNPREARRELTARSGLRALVFGNEADGLSAEELAPCDAALALDLPGDYGSLNLSHAVVLALWSLHGEDHLIDSRAVRPEATSKERRALLGLMEQALLASDYFEAADQGRLTAKLARVVQSLRLTSPDLQLLAGLFAHFARQAAGAAAPPDPAAD